MSARHGVRERCRRAAAGADVVGRARFERAEPAARLADEIGDHHRDHAPGDLVHAPPLVVIHGAALSSLRHRRPDERLGLEVGKRNEARA